MYLLSCCLLFIFIRLILILFYLRAYCFIVPYEVVLSLLYILYHNRVCVELRQQLIVVTIAALLEGITAYCLYWPVCFTLRYKVVVSSVPFMCFLFVLDRSVVLAGS